MTARIVALVLVAAVLAPTAGAAAAGPATAAVVAIDWSMPARFGGDANGDGIINLPNTRDYVHHRPWSGCDPCPAPQFPLTVHASVTGGGAPVRSWSWTVAAEGGGSERRYHTLRRDLPLLLPEGRYEVEARAVVGLPWGSVTLVGRDLVVVDDVLVVAIGDSYASGEGNPEMRRDRGVDAVWGDGADAAATEAHALAHRSTVAWPARVALAMEQRTARSSVTFVSVAASGARIDRGILAPQGELPAQLDEVERLVGERTIDLLLVQTGGNEIGFAHLVRALVDADPQFDPVCYHLMVEQAFAAAADGDWGRDVGLRFAFPFRWSCVPTARPGPDLPGLAGLPDAFARLAERVRRLSVDTTVLVSYPDPTGAGRDGAACREIVGDTTDPLRFHEVSDVEGAAAVDRVLRPLNAQLAAAAFRHGWVFVGGVADAFASGHGYCGDWPDYGYPPDFDAFPGLVESILDHPDGWYRNPGRGAAFVPGAALTWYRTATQSAVLQGPAAPYATSGTLHPNEIGHAAIAAMVLARLGD